MWIDTELNKIRATDTVVLANNRQVLAFKRTWALQKGNSALPKAFSWQQYLQTTWYNINPNTSKRLISMVESRALIAQSMLDLGQSVDNRLLDEVVKNINYCHAHLIDFSQLSKLHIQNCTLFFKWTNRYQQTKLERGLLDINDLSQLIINHNIDDIKSMTKPYIYGFKTLTPAQLNLFSRIGYQTIDTKQPNTQSHNLAFKTTHDEILSAAKWAKNLHQTQPEKHIAIVSPTLQHEYHQVKAIFDQVFDDLLSETWQKSYNISLGLSLTQYPIIQDLLLILQLSQQLNSNRINTQTFNAVITSPYIAHAKSELYPRALLVNRVLSLSKTHFKLEKISQYLRNTPALKMVIDAVTAQTTTAKNNHDKWLLSFNTDLQTWGFATDRTLSSVEYQLFNKYQKTSLGLNQLAQTQRRVSASVALVDLKNWLSQVIFQAKSAKTPIQILGSLEAEGLYFDYAWVLGMTNDFLPATLNSPRFIPSNIATQHKIPHSNFELIAKDAKNTLNNLINLANQVICSYAKVHLESKQQPSPMLEFDGKIEILKNQRQLVSIETVMETLSDTQTRELLNKHVNGGVSILKDQMACDFKGFIHRLNIEHFDAPHIGLNRAQQGDIIHKILEKIYQHISSHTNLIAYQKDELDTLISTSIKNELERYPRSGFTRIEYNRLSKLIHRFIDTEKQRDTFNVVATEQTVESNIGGLNFNTKLDRIDELENGDRIIFDYKTGNTLNNPWCGNPIKEPQMPIYALSNQIDGVAFIHAVADKISYTGLAKNKESLPSQTKQQSSCVEWGDQLKQWQQQLDQTSADYQQGQAAVLPTKGACQYCKYDSLCRVQK